jgi:hypothetical protein
VCFYHAQPNFICLPPVFFFPSNGTKTSLSKSPKLAIAKIAQKLKSPNFFFWGGLFWG